MKPHEDMLEYRFHIDAFTPDTIPLERLSEYLGYLARIMGEKADVHLARIEPGSTVPVIRVAWEAEPKVRERLQAVRVNEGPADSRRAFKEMNRRLAADNANGVLVAPDKAKVLRFPGRDAANQAEFGPISEAGMFQGLPIRIGGEKDLVPVHLEDGSETHIIHAPRRLAKEMAAHLFSTPIRVEGKGRWIRNRMGEWELQQFIADYFQVLRGGDLDADLNALRQVQGDWKKLDDPLAQLEEIRSGGVTA